MSNFRLDDQGRIIPVGNLKGKISGGGLVPGVPIWTGEASGKVIYIKDGSTNPIVSGIIKYTGTPINALNLNISNFNMISDDTKEQTSATVARWEYSTGFLLRGGVTYYLSAYSDTGSNTVYINRLSDNANLKNGASPIFYTPSQDEIVYFRCYNPNGIETVKLQLNIGGSPTEYIEYIGNTYNIDLLDYYDNFDLNIITGILHDNNNNTDHQITPINLITYYGDNTIWTDKGDSEIIYIRDWNIALNILWNTVFP